MRVLVLLMRTQSSIVVKFRFHLLAMTEKGFTSADLKNDTLLPANDGMDIDCFKTSDSVVNPVNLSSSP